MIKTKIYQADETKKLNCPKHGEVCGNNILVFEFLNKDGTKFYNHSYCLICLEEVVFNDVYLLECESNE